MLELTSQSIKDFQVCSLYYDFRYNQELSVPMPQNSLLFERFENTMKRVISFFFFRKQGGISVTYASLLARWEKLWFPKDMDAYDIAVEQHGRTNNLASYTTVAASALMKFYDDFSENDGYPLLIDESFSIPLGKKAKLASKFDLVLRYTDHYDIIKWSLSQSRPHVSTHMIEFAGLKLAWDYRSKDKKENNYYLYDLASTVPGAMPVQPTKKDTNMLKYWTNAIEGTEIFVPRRGLTSYCRSCPFDTSCRNYVFPDIDVQTGSVTNDAQG